MPMASEVHSRSARQTSVPRRRILLCYDGSAEARRALERVGEIASVVPSRVSVVSVADSIYPDPPYTGYADPRGHGVDTTTVQAVGDPADAILDTARNGADLVVVGSRHRALITRLLFGSVSAEVVVEAPCDVLILR
jgi:nucleotide-binding universal stress UspA family protein